MNRDQQEPKPKKLIKTYSTAIVDGFVKKAAACQSLDHKLTKGELRELFVSDVLRHFLTSQFSIGSGIIINHREEQSSQTDIIIYDNRILPPFIKEQHIGVYPAECVIGTIEVKSQLDKADLIKAEQNAKKLLDEIYRPKGSLYGNLDKFRPLTAVIGLEDNGLGELKEEQSGLSWIGKHIHHYFSICLVGQFSWLKLARGWELSKNNKNYEETKEFIAVFLDNLRSIAQKRIKLLSKSPFVAQERSDEFIHYDWLSIYIRDQNLFK